eukprot:gene46776-63379_t
MRNSGAVREGAASHDFGWVESSGCQMCAGTPPATRENTARYGRVSNAAVADGKINCDARNMREVVVDCSGIGSTEEFWQRYLDTAKPDGAAMFGRNLEAFWDAIEGGGPGWPGTISL